MEAVGATGGLFANVIPDDTGKLLLAHATRKYKCGDALARNDGVMEQGA